MTWFRVDDDWFSHPKTLRTSLEARGLWASAGSWCGSHNHEGIVPESALGIVAPGVPARTARRLADELVRSGLWEVVPGGWLFHDWHVLQPSRAEVEAEREKARQRQAEWRKRRRESGGSKDAA